MKLTQYLIDLQILYIHVRLVHAWPPDFKVESIGSSALKWGRKIYQNGSPLVATGLPELSNWLENLPAESRLIVLPQLNTEPLNTEHSKSLLIAISNQNCLTHFVKQSACKELKG